jgi:hypothetical protein
VSTKRGRSLPPTLGWRPAQGRYRDRAACGPLEPAQLPEPVDDGQPSYPGDVGGRSEPEAAWEEVASGFTDENEQLLVGMPADPAARLRWFGDRRRVGTGAREPGQRFWAKEILPWLYTEVARALLSGANRIDIARDLAMHPTAADKLIRRAWAWTRSRHVEADPKDVYTQFQEQLRVMAQASMVGLSMNRPRTVTEGSKDRSLEFTRYGLQLLRTQHMQVKIMKDFGVLAAIAGGQDSDRERQMDQLREEFDEALLALGGGPMIDGESEAVPDDDSILDDLEGDL